MVLIAPGWIRTALGGPDAPLTIEEAVPTVVEVLLSQLGKLGLRFLDREGSNRAVVNGRPSFADLSLAPRASTLRRKVIA